MLSLIFNTHGVCACCPFFGNLCLCTSDTLPAPMPAWRVPTGAALVVAAPAPGPTPTTKTVALSPPVLSSAAARCRRCECRRERPSLRQRPRGPLSRGGSSHRRLWHSLPRLAPLPRPRLWRWRCLRLLPHPRQPAAHVMGASARVAREHVAADWGAAADEACLPAQSTAADEGDRPSSGYQSAGDGRPLRRSRREVSADGRVTGDWGAAVDGNTAAEQWALAHGTVLADREQQYEQYGVEIGARPGAKRRCRECRPGG